MEAVVGDIIQPVVAYGVVEIRRNTENEGVCTPILELLTLIAASILGLAKCEYKELPIISGSS
jgi:hypothetical protein